MMSVTVEGTQIRRALNLKVLRGLGTGSRGRRSALEERE